MRGSNRWCVVALAIASAACDAAQPASIAESRAFQVAVSVVPDTASAWARHVVAVSDHEGLPFAIVDKQAALMVVYLGDGRVAGTTPVLLGRMPGNHASPGVGERTRLRQLRPEDRTTPAGRFATQPGHNLAGEDIVWMDYASALAIHRLRPGPPNERRAQRLASPTAADHRISAGCVVVPVPFYEAVVREVLGHGPGVVYVLPE